MPESTTQSIMLKDAVETSRRNETVLNKILGGLIVLGALQTGFIGIGTWIASSLISTQQDLSVIKEQVKVLQLEVAKLKEK